MFFFPSDFINNFPMEYGYNVVASNTFLVILLLLLNTTKLHLSYIRMHFICQLIEYRRIFFFRVRESEREK